MKRFIRSKKGLVLLATLVVAIAAASGAYAYFSSTGSGTGHATVGVSSPLVITSNPEPVGPLYPGAPPITIHVHIQNPGAGDEYLGTVTGHATSATIGCMDAWFTVGDINYNGVIPGHTTITQDTTIAMPSANVNQDACQGKTLTIAWSSN
jgi:hypothetical protein